ncbi:MAG: HAMP domain-containing sensor histidine kinase [Patescibacteria group bacterium]
MAKISEPVSIIAHQLRSPLAVLKGYLEVLLSGDLGPTNERQKEYIDDALKNLERVEKTIFNFLEASRIEGKVYKINSQPTDLIKITEEVVRDFFNWAKVFNCEIIFNKPNKIPLIYTDPEKIRDVIENFLSNSIRYRHSGPGKIEVELKQSGKNIIFSCSDNGIGIPEKDFKKVFSKFYRSEQALKIDPTGSGLGLYINKAVIDRSKGKIWFKKNKNAGMIFYFSLPIVRK